MVPQWEKKQEIKNNGTMYGSIPPDIRFSTICIWKNMLSRLTNLQVAC